MSKKKKGTGFLYTIALSRVNPDNYNGWDGYLPGTIPDMELHQEKFLEMSGFERFYKSVDPTASILGVTESFQELAKEAKAGDLVVIAYSGHGTQVKDNNSDELDKMDEALVLWDGLMVDDYLHELFCLFASGVRVVFISDSCHSGSVFRSVGAGGEGQARMMPVTIPATKVARSGKNPTELQCSLKHFGACEDHEVAYDLGYNGLFTSSLYKVLDRSSKVRYKALGELLKAEMPDYQNPTYVYAGKRNRSFDLQHVFKV